MIVNVHTDCLELEAETDIEREVLREWIEQGDMVWRMPEYSPNHKQGHLCGRFDPLVDLPDKAHIVFGYYASKGKEPYNDAVVREYVENSFIFNEEQRMLEMIKKYKTIPAAELYKATKLDLEQFSTSIRGLKNIGFIETSEDDSKNLVISYIEEGKSNDLS